MKCSSVLFIGLLVGFQLTGASPALDRNEFFANVDYNQVVGHMKELLMYLPVLMTTVKETMSGLPKISEGLNTIGMRRFLRGTRNDGICRCKQRPAENKSAESEYR